MSTETPLETKSNQAMILMTTSGDAPEAERIAQTLVEERLVVCVNILGTKEDSILSIYQWEGAIQKENEVLLVMKTLSKKLPRLETRIQELHSYSVPEIVAWPLHFVGQSYLQWILDSLA